MLIHAPTIDITTASLALEPQYQQTHLLQLTLLHSAFHSIYTTWSASARRALAHKFADAVGHAAAVKEAERESRLRTNVAALAEWGGGPDGLLGEHVQQLAGVVQEAEMLCDAETGRVRNVVEGFGAWIECVEEMWRAREEGSGAAAVEFIDGLGEEWREEGRVLLRRLGGLVSVLDGLERPREGSSVAAVMRDVGALLVGCLEELDTVLKMERMVVNMENEWVDQQLADLGGGLMLRNGMGERLTT
jgi:hypothetical protein